MRRRALLMSGRKRFINELVWYAPLNGDRMDYSRKFPPNPTLSTTILGFTSFGDFQALAGNGSVSGGTFSKATYPKIILLDGLGNQINFSLSAIVNTNDSFSSGQVLGNEVWGTTLEPSYSFRIVSGAPYFTKYQTKTVYRRFICPVKVVNDQFTHVAFVCNENDVAYFYVNGVKHPAIVTESGAYTAMLNNSANNFYIAGTNNQAYFNGYLRELGMFKNYLLTDEDIAWIYNGGNFRKLL